MNSIPELLETTKSKRVEEFVKRNSSLLTGLRNYQLDGVLFLVPEVDTIDRKRYSRSRLRFPILKYGTKARINIPGYGIYDMAKSNGGYYFTMVVANQDLIKPILTKFKCSEYFSMHFILVWYLIKELYDSGTRFKIQDSVFTGLFDGFSDPNSNLEIILTLLPVKDKDISPDRLYLSLLSN